MSRRNVIRKNALPTKRNQRKSAFDKLLDTFCQLPEATQVVVVIGFLLLVAWIVTKPEVLQGIVRAFQFWFVARTIFIS
jgi:hypothetical protein